MIPLFATIAVRAAALPDPEQIRRTAEEVLSRPEFHTVESVDPRASFTVWLLGLLLRVLAPVLRFFGGLWDMSPALALIVAILLIAVLVALVAHMVYSFRQAIQGRSKLPPLRARGATVLDPQVLECQAEEAAERQDYIQAVRLLFRASLLRLEQAYRRGTRPGTTNREFLRRYDDTPACVALQMFVDTIDDKWYGHSTCDRNDYLRCQQAHAQLYGIPGGMAHAQGA